MSHSHDTPILIVPASFALTGGHTTQSCPEELRSLLGCGWRLILLKDYRATTPSSLGKTYLEHLLKIVEPGTH